MKGDGWRHGGSLKRSLTSQALLGYAMSVDQPVRNDDGSPVVRAEPILSCEVFDRVGAELEARSRRGKPNHKSTALLLLRVIFCGVWATRVPGEARAGEGVEVQVCVGSVQTSL